MKKHSAGLLLYRMKDGQPEVLLAHWGGPFHAKRDEGHWTLPKGEYNQDEEPLAAAKREFQEELGHQPAENELLDLGEVEQKNNKIVRIWAAEGDLDASRVTSNTFELEWPPHSGVAQAFPKLTEPAGSRWPRRPRNFIRRKWSS